MDATTAALTFGAGLVMGAINNVAGGGGALGLVALEAGGLSTTAANASLRPAAITISIGGSLGFRTRAQPVPQEAWLYGLMTLPGAVAGSVLALTMPVLVYRAVLAVILATVLVQQLWPRPPRPAADRRRAWLAPVMFTLVGVHMGFVQVGAGLIIMAAMTALRSGDLLRINSAKMVIVLLSSATSVAVLAVAEETHWPAALALAFGSGIGCFAASRWSVARGHGGVRLAVLVICVLVLLRLVWQIVADA